MQEQQHIKKTTEAHEALVVGLACSAPKQKDIDHDMARAFVADVGSMGHAPRGAPGAGSDGAH